jgi:hypothetical protein
MVITNQESAGAVAIPAEDYLANIAHVSREVLEAMLHATLEACATDDFAEWAEYQRQAAVIEAIGEFRFPGFGQRFHRVN